MSAAQVWRTDEQRVTARVVVLASADAGLRQRLGLELTGMRWSVLEAGGGADAMAKIELARPEALIVDGWLPDLEVGEFADQMILLYPGMDVVRVNGGAGNGQGTRSARRNELLHAIREAQESGVADVLEMPRPVVPVVDISKHAEVVQAIPEMIGESAPMRDLARMIRLVAPRSATVLIEGETGTGKEVVAKALHRLSSRAGKPFVVLNCAAIPESLLEAELFGHTRGAFTGAVQSRTGRIEAAHGGTLFLDEIGEMPLALQAKMLRFLECGELQKVGENETMRVDVRVIAATHQPLEQRSEERSFRLDLYHRLAVFPLEVPALRERMEDLPLLVEFFLEQQGRETPRKSISAPAMERLTKHPWPGNVRELMHVLERAGILAGDRAEIGADEIRIRSKPR
jgi:transcriptional regulator with GAF, ATPase, and Fis domain